MSKTQQFEPGCYGDGARGVYLPLHVIRFAQAEGFTTNDPIDTDDEFILETELDAVEWLNSHTNYPDNYYWSFNTNGDFGLWTLEEN